MPHIKLTFCGWAVYRSKEHSSYGLPVVVRENVGNAWDAYVRYMEG